MIRKILLSSVAIVATSISAMAADLPARLPPPPFVAPLFSWTGIYVGGQVGYEAGRDSITAPGLFTIASSPSGVLGGAHVGYNYQYNSFLVVGVEGDVNGGGYSGHVFNPLFGTIDSTRDSIDGSVRGRVGLALDHALLYATGGAAFASVSDSYAGATYSSFSRTLFGWTVGGGVEYAINNNWSIRGEYRYTLYENYGEFPGGVITPRNHYQSDNRVQAGFSYKFSTYVPAPIVAKY